MIKNQTQDVNFWDAIRAYRQYKTPIQPEVIEWAKNWPDKILHLAVATGTRFVECEPSFLEQLKKDTSSIDFHSIVRYCNNSLNGRWSELEDLLLTNNNSDVKLSRIIEYAANVIKGRWIDAEKFINEPRRIIDYARQVLNDRWQEKEKFLLKDPRVIFDYCYYVMNRNRWSEGEEVLLNCDYADKINSICTYSKYIIRGRWPEAEKLAKKDPQFAFAYANSVIGGRWEEGEPAIAKNPSYAFTYAQEVIKGSFPLAEKTILSSKYYFDYFTFSTTATRELVQKLASQFDPNMTVAEILKMVSDGRNKDFETKLLNSTHSQKKAVWYAANVLKSRWIEAEEIIKRSAKWSVAYARDVIKGRWEEAEKTIAKDPKYLADYGVEVIKDQLPILLHNALMAEKLKGNEEKKLNRYFEMLEHKDAGTKFQ